MPNDRAYFAEQLKPTERLLARLCLIIVAGFGIIVCLLVWYGARFGSVTALQARIESHEHTIAHQREMAAQARDRAERIDPRPQDIERLQGLIRRLEAIMGDTP